MKKFFHELQRRNVIKASISYIAISWVFLEASGIIFPILGIDPEFAKYLLIVLLIGFPFTGMFMVPPIVVPRDGVWTSHV